jgi:two-component system, chemotaxis family, chemotaxis protein CheY
MTRTVLMVEDDPDVRETIAEILADEGYRVVTAEDGQQALEHLRGGLRPTVILLDLMMRGMDGFEFRAQQRADSALAAIPVVVLTAGRQTTAQEEELDVEVLLRKPIAMADLLEVLSKYAET